MDILILCGVFATENEKEIIEKATAPVEFSANIFQEKLINGFLKLKKQDENIKVSVLSAPFIGAYPMGSRIKQFKKFKNSQSKYIYVPFNNIWGIRNFSRTSALKKAIKFFSKSKEKEKLLLVYAAHTPFIKAAEYAKKLDPNIKICLYVLDLPQYMNLLSNKGKVYNFAKKYDIASMIKHMRCVDSYVLLTEQMKNCLPVGDKPYFVSEGIFDSLVPPECFEKSKGNERYIVYTGKLEEKFGVLDLVDSMEYIEDNNVRLVICGGGEGLKYAHEASLRDKRIIPLGQVSPKVAQEWREKGDVLINPRQNNEEYTRYSFPSKNIEYLLSGKPTVAYLLDGMDEIYKNFIFEIDPCCEAPKAIADALKKALNASEDEIRKRSKSYFEYAEKKIFAEEIARRIISTNYDL